MTNLTNQFSFHKELEGLINFKIKSSFILVEYLFFYESFLRKRSVKFQKSYNFFLNAIAIDNRDTIKVRVEPYAGKNSFVIKMKNFLISHIKDELTDALIHGSLGNYDENNYSDFDALIIIGNDVLLNTARLTRTIKKLNEARKIMLQCDPLQHHGWFILTEGELKNFNESYFPPVLFNYAKSLLYEHSYDLSLTLSGDKNYIHEFNTLVEGLLKLLPQKGSIKNLYQLKSVLSRFMLLPTLYFQAKYKKGIFKKDSFAEVKKEFINSEWKVMDEISQVRKEWNPCLTSFQRKIILNNYFISHKILSPFYPRIPLYLKDKLENELFPKMNIFAELMLKKLQPNS